MVFGFLKACLYAISSFTLRSLKTVELNGSHRHALYIPFEWSTSFVSTMDVDDILPITCLYF